MGQRVGNYAPFRIDIHDAAIRSAGIGLAAVALHRLRDALTVRALRKQRAKSPLPPHAAIQAPTAVLMIRPRTFQPNPETAADNAFQSAAVADVAERQSVAAQAQVEVAAVATALRGEGVGVEMFDDREGIDTPTQSSPTTGSRPTMTAAWCSTQWPPRAAGVNAVTTLSRG